MGNQPGNGEPARKWARLDSSRLSPEPVLTLSPRVQCCLALRLRGAIEGARYELVWGLGHALVTSLSALTLCGHFWKFLHSPGGSLHPCPHPTSSGTSISVFQAFYPLPLLMHSLLQGVLHLLLPWHCLYVKVPTWKVPSFQERPPHTHTHRFFPSFFQFLFVFTTAFSPHFSPH